MIDFYVDSSALIKRYVTETGSQWIETIINPDTGNLCVTSRMTMVEVFSALNRRRREGNLPHNNYQVALKSFLFDCHNQYQFNELTLDLMKISQVLLENHPLKAIDAVQLASSIVANKVLLNSNLPSLKFVSADERLNAAALAEGFNIENPNHH